MWVSFDVYKPSHILLGIYSILTILSFLADGLIVKVTFPPLSSSSTNQQQRTFRFQSKFVETKAMVEEEKAKRFLYRGTFGTAPWGLVEPPKNGLNEDPWMDQPMACKMVSNAF